MVKQNNSMKFLLLVINGRAQVNEIHIGSRRPDPRGRDLDLVSAFKPYPNVQGIRREIPYIPASSWVGVLRHLLEKYYNLSAQSPRIRRRGSDIIIAPIHECKTLDEKLRCPVCKLFARRDIVAWFDDMEPLGLSYRVQLGNRAGEYLVYNEENQLVAQVFVKDEVVIPRDIEKTLIEPSQVGLEGDQLISGEELTKRGFRFETIPRQVQVISGIFKFEAKFDMNKLNFDDIKSFFVGLALLEDRYVGRRGSRGYGRIKINDLSFELRNAKYYEGGTSSKLEVKYNRPRDILAHWEEIKKIYEETAKKLLKS